MHTNWRPASALAISFVCSFLPGCGFLPGFSPTEQPQLYYLPVADVATQVSCELQNVLSEYLDYQEHYRADVDPDNPNQLAPARWYISGDNVQVTLTLSTDNSGYANFTGLDLKALGFPSLASFITSTTSGGVSVPTLQARLTPTRSAKAILIFSVSPNSPPNQLVLVSSEFDAFHVGEPFDQNNHAQGGVGPYTYHLFGATPAGTTFHSSTGQVSGRLTEPPGPFAYVIQVSDFNHNTADRLVSGTISPAGVTDASAAQAPFALSSTSSKYMAVGKEYVQNNQVQEEGEYEFSKIAGELPAGTTLVLNSDGRSATVQGTPTKAGPFVYIIQATAKDDSKNRVTQLITGRILVSDAAPKSNVGNPCPEWARHLDHNLFLKTWLHNYFDKINAVTQTAEKDYSTNPLCDLSVIQQSSRYNTPCLPDRTTFTSVELSTSFKILADINAGLTPAAFDSSVFLVPISGFTADLNSDYSDEIDIKMTLCDNTKGGCSSAKALGLLDPISPLYEDQCHAYAVLSPIEGTNVQPPKDVVGVIDQHSQQKIELTCSRALGCYIPKTSANAAPKSCPHPVYGKSS